MPDNDRCVSCGRALAWGRFEATFRLRNGRLRHVLDLPGCVCVACSVIYLDARLLELAGLVGARCVAAVGSERTLAAGAAAPAGWTAPGTPA